MSHPTGSQTLDQIAKGRFVRVVMVLGDDDAIARRLHDLGVRTGVRIEVIRRAPLGDPTVFELCGYQLCLRRSESARVQITPDGAALAPDSNRATSRRGQGSP